MITVTNNSHRAKRLPLARGGFLLIAPGTTETAAFQFSCDLAALEAGGLAIHGGAAVNVVNNHDADLALPLGGPVLRPGVATKVERWSIIKGHPVVKSWLAAKVIEEEAGASPARVETAPVSMAPEQPDAAPAPDLSDLRGQYQELFGKRAYHGWSAEELQSKIDAKLAE